MATLVNCTFNSFIKLTLGETYKLKQINVWKRMSIIIMSMMCRHLSPKTSLATGERQMYLQASIMLRIGKGILPFLRVGDWTLVFF